MTQLIAKALGDRINDLLLSLQVVRDALEGMHQGHAHQLIPLSGQIRALVSDRSKGNTPLLLDVAGQLGVKLDFWAMPGVDDPSANLPADPDFHFAGFPITCNQILPAQRRLSITQLLAHRIVRYRGSDYTIDQMVRLLAEKAGGAHYASRIPKDLVQLLTIQVFEQPILATGLRQLAESIYERAVQLLSLRTDLDFFVRLAVVPPLDQKDHECLLDFRYPETPCQLTLTLAPAHELVVTVRGIGGRVVQASSPAPLEWSTPHYIQVALRLGDRLESEITLAIDNAPPIIQRTDGPVFFPSQTRDAVFTINACADERQSSTYLGLAEMFILGASSPADLAAAARYAAQQATSGPLDCAVYTPTGMGIAPVGTGDLTNRGSVVKGSLDKLLAGGYRLG